MCKHPLMILGNSNETKGFGVAEQGRKEKANEERKSKTHTVEVEQVHNVTGRFGVAFTTECITFGFAKYENA
jgi:hypothetical protein